MKAFIPTAVASLVTTLFAASAFATEPATISTTDTAAKHETTMHTEAKQHGQHHHKKHHNTAKHKFSNHKAEHKAEEAMPVTPAAK